jgi:intracellular sulfur oxidation DsrE/DsrF family protein
MRTDMWSYHGIPLMKTLLALLTFTMFFAVGSGAETTNKSKGESTVMLKAVIHVNFADSERQEHALGNIDNILKEVRAAQIAVVCHGNGMNLVVAKDAKHSEKITALMTQGVDFVACENTMKKKAITKGELAAGVTTVPSGAVEVLRKQQEGYGYFRP